jgi:hypothetical protein
MILRALLRIAHTRIDLRAPLKVCAVILTALGSCGFTFLNDPLIENGEYVPVTGSYECEFTLAKKTLAGKDTWTLLEFGGSGMPRKDYVYYQVDSDKNSDRAMRFIKISKDLYLAQWSALKLPPTGDNGSSIIMLFMDLSTKGKIVFLIQDKGKRSGIADLAAKAGVRLEQAAGENLLLGANSDILNFFKRHDRSLMVTAYVCQKNTEARSPVTDPAGDVYVGTWSADIIYDITEKDGEFIVKNEAYNATSTYSINGNILVDKNPARKLTISAISNNVVSFSINGKEASRWERIGAPQAAGPKNAFAGKWKARLVSEIRRIGNDFFLRGLTQKSSYLTSWQFVDGVLKSKSGQILKYDKTRDVITQDVPAGNTTVTRVRIK